MLNERGFLKKKKDWVCVVKKDWVCVVEEEE